MAAKRITSMAPNRFILILTFTVAGLAQSQPASTAQDEFAKLTSDAEKILAKLGGLKGIEERIALLERKILEGKTKSQGNPTAPLSGAPAPVLAKVSPAVAIKAPVEPVEEITINMKRPMVEDEEPFDPAKLLAAEAADAAEAALRAENAAATARAAAGVAAARAAEAAKQVRAAAAEPASATAVQPSPTPASPVVDTSLVSPKVKRRVLPELSSSLRNSLSEEVTVSLSVEVAANGEVTGASPLEKGTPLIDQLNAVAIEAVRRWQFEAGTQDGKAVASQTTVRFKFTN